MVWKLSSLFSGEIRQSGSSLIDAFSVPAAASSLSSSIPLLAVPALFLATLGGGVFGAPLYEGSSGSGSSISNGSNNLDDTFPAPDAKPATLKSVAHIENDVYEVVVYSPSMDREVKNEVILPGGPDNDSPRPTFYLLMGADGAANGWSWRNSSDYQEFFQDKLVNVVTPIGSVSSMQADWYREDKATGRNKWLTYFTKELPPLIDEHFHGTGSDAIAGLSMSGGPALHIAAMEDRYVAAGTYSSCPSTTGLVGQAFAYGTVKQFKGDPSKMWGRAWDRAWAAHSPVRNVDDLKGKTLFLTASRGLPSKWDVPVEDSPEPLLVPDEQLAYTCTLHFLSEARRKGLDPDWYEFEEGTHNYGLFRRELLASWETLGPALGVSSR